MMRLRIICTLVPAAFLACAQDLDTSASDAFATASSSAPDTAASTVIAAPTIEVDPLDPAKTTTSACSKTALDAHAILSTYCGSCHDQGNASLGAPQFSFLLDDEKLIATVWTVGAEQRRFVDPGDPDNSWIYKRPLLGTMPPAQTDIRNSDYPRPSISELSVIYEWIAHCVGNGADSARFNFERDAQNWTALPAGTGSGTMGAEISQRQHFAGNSALAGNIAGDAADTFALDVQNPGVPAGAAIVYHVHVPAGAPVDKVTAYATDVDGAKLASAASPISGVWSTMTLSVPAKAKAIQHVGVSVHTTRAWSGSVFVDSISW